MLLDLRICIEPQHLLEGVSMRAGSVATLRTPCLQRPGTRWFDPGVLRTKAYSFSN
jgi:hypothetical protein